MKMTSRKTYIKGETQGDLRIGWASWDDGSYTARSIKWAYQDKSGKISRGAPEIPFDILLDMVTYAAEQGELNAYPEEAKAAYEALEAKLKGGGTKSK